jgi:hypothetical protein
MADDGPPPRPASASEAGSAGAPFSAPPALEPAAVVSAARRLSHAASSRQRQRQAAFLELVKSRPPANVDGLLGFVTDLRRRRQYTDEESDAMRSCESGRVLAAAIRRCEGLRDQVRRGAELAAAAAAADEEEQAVAAKQRREMLQQATNRYLDCLSYHSCPPRWRAYSSCWSDLGGLTAEQAAELHRAGVGVLDFVCRRERTDLERCVGGHVSSAVRHADAPWDEWRDDRDGDDAL